MTRRLDYAQLLARDEIVGAPAPRACNDRSFELPPALYIATAVMFFGFVSVLSFAFRSPGMAVPFGICIAFIAAFFAVPTIFVRMKPEESRTPALQWSRFMEEGIATATGRAGGAEAAVLVLVLPFLILCWAVAIAVIAAVV